VMKCNLSIFFFCYCAFCAISQNLLINPWPWILSFIVLSAPVMSKGTFTKVCDRLKDANRTGENSGLAGQGSCY
jgi:hypothetical protein